MALKYGSKYIAMVLDNIKKYRYEDPDYILV